MVWQYAKDNQLIIVTKNADFEKFALTVGLPVVIHLRAGQRSRRKLWELLAQWWPTARNASQRSGCRLVQIFPDCVEVV